MYCFSSVSNELSFLIWAVYTGTDTSTHIHGCTSARPFIPICDSADSIVRVQLPRNLCVSMLQCKAPTNDSTAYTLQGKSKQNEQADDGLTTWVKCFILQFSKMDNCFFVLSIYRLNISLEKKKLKWYRNQDTKLKMYNRPPRTYSHKRKCIAININMVNIDFDYLFGLNMPRKIMTENHKADLHYRGIAIEKSKSKCVCVWFIFVWSATYCIEKCHFGIPFATNTHTHSCIGKYAPHILSAALHIRLGEALTRYVLRPSNIHTVVNN